MTPVRFPAYLQGLQALGKRAQDFREVGGCLVRLAAVPFLEAALADIQEADPLRLIPGWALLREAAAEEERSAQEFAQMMGDENNDGVRPPRPVAVSIAELGARYPRAAAYLQAEAWSHAAHDQKAVAGERARKRLLAGENAEIVLRDMEQQWTEAAARALGN